MLHQRGVYHRDLKAESLLIRHLVRPAVLGRYTLAVLPDGRKYPVCIVLGDRDGRVPKREGSKEGAAVMNRELPVSAVQRWP